MNILKIMYSGKHLDALEWFFSDDRGPVRKNGVFHTELILASEGVADLSLSRMTEHLTLSLREMIATGPRKLILFACIRNLVLSVMTHTS